MPPPIMILMPPASKTASGGNPLAPKMFDRRASNTFNYFSTLNPERRQIINAVMEVMATGGKAAERILEAPEEDREKAIEANLSIFDNPLMSSLERFSLGPLYDTMDFQNLPTGAQRRLLEQGVIISPMYGLLRPDDLVPDHSLKIEAKLPLLGKVIDFWKVMVSEVLNELLNERFVWNFLPHSHRKMWDSDENYSNIVNVEFYSDYGGERRLVDGARAIRGFMTHYIVEESASTKEMMLQTKYPEGFRVDREATKWEEDDKVAKLVMVTRKKYPR